MFKKAFFYGDGTDNVVYLTQKQADAVNKIQITEIPEGDDNYVEINLDRTEIKHYNSATDVLNKYCAANAVYWNNTDEPMLRRK